MTVKLKTPSNGSVSLTPQDTAADVVLTVPAKTGTVMNSGNMPAFIAYPTSEQSVTPNTATKIIFAGELADTNNCFTNSRFTPNVAGYYIFTVMLHAINSPNGCFGSIYKNGSEYSRVAHAASSILASGSTIVYLNGTTDYVEVYASTPATAFYSGINLMSFSGCLLRAA